MDKQTDVLGYLGLGVSVAGAIASVALNNLLPLSVGSTIGIGCNLFSRKQLEESLVNEINSQQESIETLLSTVQDNHQQLSEALVNNKADVGNQLDDFKGKINESLNEQESKLLSELGRLDAQAQSIREIVVNLQEVENLSQELRVTPESASFFYERGNSHAKLGNVAGAMADYTEAIKKDSTYAQAYHKRGVLYLESGSKQKAVDDLRKASLLYFEKGEIDGYHQAREMSRNIHQLHPEGNGHHKEMVVGTELFA
jgi:tetratricopeptide (TPR) repeat protein